ncbi:MAG: biotin synthase BioB [Planctomycetes bacterium]|nr:biotin synthase BioB [Planctomycetota bacterium]
METPIPIRTQEALHLFSLEGAALYALYARAGAVREALKGKKIKLCGIINAKSGRCSEDCSFCAQSAHHHAEVPVYPLVKEEEILDRAHALAERGVREFSIVTSGKRLRTEKEIASVCRAITRLKEEGRVFRCASLGVLPAEVLVRLREAGLTKYHHNLETARSFFPKICTTHDYEEDIATVRAAKDAGLKVCSGGLFGLGESRAQRVELARTLQELDVDAVPINFLNPIEGTPLQDQPLLTPMECLKIIAVYRLMLPEKDLYLCGGREVNLRDLQSWIFMAGANGMMVGNYLTTSGRNLDLDLAMIKDLGLEPKKMPACPEALEGEVP